MCGDRLPACPGGVHRLNGVRYTHYICFVLLWWLYVANIVVAALSRSVHLISHMISLCLSAKKGQLVRSLLEKYDKSGGKLVIPDNNRAVNVSHNIALRRIISLVSYQGRCL